MKFLHLSDLHIGKRINEFSMLAEQKNILKQVVDIAVDKAVDAVIIAGDIYDKSVPGADAVSIFDEFITELSAANKKIYMVSGNHDSAERIDFGKKLFENSGLYIAGIYNGGIDKISARDNYGTINIWLMPFIKPAMVRRDFPECESYDDAFRTVIEHADINYDERNILVAHQYFTDGAFVPERSESEVVNVGTLDNIDISYIDKFDYVALGHIHKPQKFKNGRIRYSGSPIKYSFSEEKDVKSVPVVEINEKGSIDVELVKLVPEKDMRVIEGSIDYLLSEEKLSEGNVNDYIKAVLTDENELYDAIGRIRNAYPNVMKLEFKNSRNAYNSEYNFYADEVESKSELQLFEEFFERQNNRLMSDDEKECVERLLEDILGGDL